MATFCSGSLKARKVQWICHTLCLATALAFSLAASKEPPHATLGNTITLIPSGASFKIPGRWVYLHEEEALDNLELTRAELERAKDPGDVEWHKEYARIVNAVLPFENCTVQLGSDNWGEKSAGYTDLYMRIYLGDWSASQLETMLKGAGLKEAHAITDKQRKLSTPSLPSLESKRVEAWQRFRLILPLQYADYGGIADLDFFFRRFGKTSVVIVFMYYAESNETYAIRGILDSFKMPRTGERR